MSVNAKTQALLREWYPSGGLRRVEYFGEDAAERASVQYTPGQLLGELHCGSKPLLAPHADDATLCGFRGLPSTVSIYFANGKLRETTTFLAGVSQKSTAFYMHRMAWHRAAQACR